MNWSKNADIHDESQLVQHVESVLGQVEGQRALHKAKVEILGENRLSALTFRQQNRKCSGIAAGSSEHNYSVSVWLDATLASECTCPAADTRALCKHAIAVALHFVRITRQDAPTDPAIEHVANSTAPNQTCDQHNPPQQKDSTLRQAQQSITEAHNAFDPASRHQSGKPVHKRKLPRMLTQPTPAVTTTRMAKKLPAKSANNHQVSQPRPCPETACGSGGSATKAVVPRRKTAKRAGTPGLTAAKRKKGCKDNSLLQVDGVMGQLRLRLSGPEMLAISDDQLLEEVRCVLHRSNSEAAVTALPSPHRTPSSIVSIHEQQQTFPLMSSPGTAVSSAGKEARVDKDTTHGRRHNVSSQFAPKAGSWPLNTSAHAVQEDTVGHKAIENLETQPLETLCYTAPQRLQPQVNLQPSVQPSVQCTPYDCISSAEALNVEHQRQVQHDMHAQRESLAQRPRQLVPAEALSRSSAPQLISSARHHDGNASGEIMAALVRPSASKDEKGHTTKSTSIWDTIDLPRTVFTRQVSKGQLQHKPQASCLEGREPRDLSLATSSSTAALRKKQHRSAFSYFDGMLKDDDALRITGDKANQ